MELKSLIQFQEKINNETHSRYNSWEYCYDAFGDGSKETNQPNQKLSLQTID